MAKPWSDVASHPDFVNADPDTRQAIREQYFNDVVAPRVPAEEVDAAFQAFLHDTGASVGAGAPVSSVVEEDVPEAKDAPAKGFFANLKNPKDTMMEAGGSWMADSYRALTGAGKERLERKRRTAQAAESRFLGDLSSEMTRLEVEGNTDTAEYKELKHEWDQAQAKEEIPEFKLSDVGKAISADPGAFAAHFLNTMAADPEFLAIPIGYEVAATRATAAIIKASPKLVKTSKGAGVAAGSASAAALGGGLAAGGTAASTYVDEGEVNLEEVEQNAKYGAGFGVGGALMFQFFKGLRRSLTRIKATTGAEPEAVAKDIIKETSQTQDIGQALRNVYTKLGVEKEADEVMEEVNSSMAGEIASLKKQDKITQELVDDPVSPAIPYKKPELSLGKYEEPVTPAHAMPSTDYDVPTLTLEQFQASRRGINPRTGEPYKLPTLKKKYEAYRTMRELSLEGELHAPNYARPAHEVASEVLSHKLWRETPQNIVDLEKEIGFQTIEKHMDTAMRKAFREALAKKRSQMPDGIQVPKGQRGEIDPKLLAGLSLIPISAFTIAMNDGVRIDDAIGVAVLVGGGYFGAKVLSRYLRSKHAYLLEKPKLSIRNNAEEWQGNIIKAWRSHWQVANSIKDITGGKNATGVARRDSITRAIDKGAVHTLSEADQEVAKSAQQFFDTMGRFALEQGLIKDMIKNYVPHLWEIPPGKSVDDVVSLLEKRYKAMSTKTPHAEKRKIPLLEIGEAAGLKPRTTDIADLMYMYGQSIMRAKYNKEFIQGVKEMKSPDGIPYMVPAKNKHKMDNWQDYVQIKHPQLDRFVIHKDIAPGMRLIFDEEPGAIMKALQTVNFVFKRQLVALSGFHANALLESAIMAGTIPATGKGGILKYPVRLGSWTVQTLRGKSPALEMLRKGEAGDVVDELLDAGLQIGRIDDVGGDIFYDSLSALTGVLDRVAPLKPLSMGVKGYAYANKWVDKIMWDRVATSGKVATAIRKLEALTTKYPKLSRKEAARMAAEFTNDAFGGLNWQAMAMKTETRLGQLIANAAFSPSGRRIMQLAMFAPDWTIANIRILFKAIPGITKDKKMARLYQAYAARGALLYATVGDALNIIFSGQHIWENDDPTRINLGNGQEMIFSKQFSEPFKWISEPGKSALNKMGILPKIALTSASNRKWLSPGGSPKIYEKDDSPSVVAGKIGKNIAKDLVPIWLQQVAEQGTEVGLAGLTGHPIYGKEESATDRMFNRNNDKYDELYKKLNKE